MTDMLLAGAYLLGAVLTFWFLFLPEARKDSWNGEGETLVLGFLVLSVVVAWWLFLLIHGIGYVVKKALL